MTAPLLGMSLLPDPAHLSLMRRAIEDHAEILEITPETLWDEQLEPSDRHALVHGIVHGSGLPVVAHGIALSPGTPGTDERLERHLAAIAREQDAFGFQWYSEHLGFTRAGDLVAALPLPLPPTNDALVAVAERMRRLASVTLDVALENQASLFALGNPAQEPDFLNRACEAARCRLVLDLHNAHANCLNFGLSLDEWIAALDPTLVIEIHVSGGSDSNAAWLASGRTFRLDSHDGAVPEPVWAALARWLPRLPDVRAVILERNDGSLDSSNVADFEREAARLRSILC